MKENKQNKLVGYADTACGKDSPKSKSNPKKQMKINYAELAYPFPDCEHNQVQMPEYEEECSYYDVPLPVMRANQTNNAEQNDNDFQSDQYIFFEDDPFRDTQLPKTDKECCTNVRNNVFHDLQETQKIKGSFTKSHSTDNVPHDNSCDEKIFSSSEIYKHYPIANKSTQDHKDIRRSWSGPAHSYSNPAYMGVFDHRLLGAGGEGQKEKANGNEKNGNENDNLEFYEEDFQILEAQGFSRDAIKRALIVADNNFALARNILKEFAKSSPNQ